MIPYTDFLYFGISLYALLPNLVFSWFKRLSKVWLAAATGLMLAIQYSTLRHVTKDSAVWELWFVLAFALLEYWLAAGFLSIRKRRANRGTFYAAIVLALAPLLAGKFLPFFQSSYNLVFLGLSYITFRCLDVIIAIQDGAIQALPPIQYLVFLLFFPTISSGPIDRFQRFHEDWERQRLGGEILKDLDGAVHRVMIGFLYKFILAALIKQYWLDPAAAGTGFWPIVSYMYAYSFYLFFDFAGYSAFAVGFSYLFGIHTPDNFHLPFLARNIRDFWNRWHISLSTWFRDHVYSRFVFAAIQGRWFKSKYTASYLGFLISMGLMGLWHGTAWHYLIYGLYHGVLLILGDLLGRLNKQKHWWNGKNLGWQAFSTLLTFQFVCFGLLIFSGRLG